MNAQFCLETAMMVEAERRLGLLGPLAAVTVFKYQAVRERARQTRVPPGILNQWNRLYQDGGVTALQPNNWVELDNERREITQERYEFVQPYGDQPIIDDMDACLADISERCGGSYSTARRWLCRYRIGGLWGLTSTYDPTKKPVNKQPPPRDMGSLDNSTLQIMFERREIIQGLVESQHVTQHAVEARAMEVGKSTRTLWNYISAYNTHGLAGLAPKQRSRDSHLNERMTNIIVGLRLREPSWTYILIHERVVEIARQLGESLPSLWQVRKICHEIPDQLLLWGTNATNQFRNKYRVSGTMEFGGIVFQLDHTQIDVLSRDLRTPRFRKSGGVTRLWLTTCLETRSRVIPAWRFGYDRPNSHTVASVIRESILARPGGLPDEIWVDWGKELISRHVMELTREMGIVLHPCRKGTPEHKGRQERFFRTLNAGLWRKTPGYVGSSVAKRPQNVTAELTSDEVVQAFESFLDRYHHRVHRALKMSPMEFWTKNFFTPPVDEVDARQLDILLLESDFRTVGKTGIRYGNRVFWHPDIAPIIGTEVMIRADTRYSTPDTIEVFNEGYHVCTVTAIDMDDGVYPSNIDVADAKERQNQHWETLADNAEMALKNAEQKVEKPARKGGAVEKIHSSSLAVATNSTPHTPARRNDPLLRIYNKHNKHDVD